MAKRRRQLDAVPLQELLPGVLKGMQPRNKGQVAKIKKAWLEVVGEPVAKHARPTALTNGILSVEVTSSSVKYELATFRAEAVLEGLKQRLPGVFLRTIRYRLGR
jgi:predicted nucleic acid-binding Zn ribbon protein